MSFWHKNLVEQADEQRAERIMLKKQRKQDPKAKGLGAVSIPRSGPRAVHQRNEDRHVLRGKTATATIDGEVLDVSLLNLSSNGVMIACKYPVGIGDEIAIAIEECAPITTAVRWVRGGKIGLEFIAETEIIAEAGVRDYIVKAIRKEADETYYDGSTMQVGTERRDIAKRHQLVWVGKLRNGEREATARLRNISSTGAMISLPETIGLADGSRVTLALASIGQITGKVRWHAGQELGLEFDEAFDVSLLVNESCAELAPDDDAGGLGRAEEEDGSSDFDSLRIRHGKVENPHHAPEMEYRKVSLDDLYNTLYPGGRPTIGDSQEP